MAAENPLFEMGFPAPTVTAQEIDTLPSRLAQARGVQMAASQKASAAIDTLLEPARQSADNAVGALLEPVETVLTDAGHGAAQAVQRGQLATVQALQHPLVQALGYGYVNQGTPVLSPTGRKTRRKKSGNGAILDQLPPPPPPPNPAPAPVVTEYGVLVNCATKQIVAVPGLPGEWIQPGWKPPPNWVVAAYIQMLPDAVPPWLSSYGKQLYDAAVSTRKCVPSG